MPQAGDPLMFDADGQPIDYQTFAAGWGFTVTQGQQVRVSELHISKPGEVELIATGPPDLTLIAYTGNHDGQQSGLGQVKIEGSRGWYPSSGRGGPGVVECGDAAVRDIGWFGDHLHVTKIVFERVGTQPSPPVQPPTPEPPTPAGPTWVLAFADAAANHPEYGAAVTDIVYAPAMDVDDQHRPAMQIGEHTILVWNGNSVWALPRPQ